MTLLGRRQPCHCGSGRLYKNCCYAKDAAAAAKEKRDKMELGKIATSTKVDLSKIGIPGEETSLLITYTTADGKEFPKEGSKGEYEIVFFFHRPGVLLDEESYSLGTEDHIGSSLLAMANPAITFNDPRFDGQDTKIKLYAATGDGLKAETFGSANKEGYLSDMRITIAADSVLDAGTRAKSLLIPAISALSFSLDIPLHISHTVVREIKTGVVTRDIIVPFQAATAVVQPFEQSPEARVLFNRYRDGINSDDPNWRFLCFASIVEQLWKRTKDDKNNKVDLERISIPQKDAEFLAWIKSAFPQSYSVTDEIYLQDTPSEARGMTTNEVIVKYIRPLRASIAHSLLEDGALPSERDDVKHRVEVRRWATLLRCITRIHLHAMFPTVWAPTKAG